MRRAGLWWLLLAAACAVGRPPPPPRAAVRCLPAGTCFSAHLDNTSYAAASSACSRRQGGLAWVSGEPELRLLLGLLAEAAVSTPALLWVGLKRNASTCTHAEHPLRGFTWEGVGGGTAPQEVPAALGRWVKEPVRSCLTVRCAGLHLAVTPESSPSWGWKERVCQRESPGYVCKYQYEGACPDLNPAGAFALDYHLPFEERSAGPGFSPQDTVLTVACPGGEVRLTCQPGPGGFAWKAAEEPLCPCPVGLRSPGSGLCTKAAGCRDAAGGFACASTLGGGDGTPCTETVPTAAGGPAVSQGAGEEGWRPSIPPSGGSAGPPAATAAAAGGQKTAGLPPSSSSSSSNYVFILVTVAVVVLVILVMTVLGVFKICFNKKSEGRGDKEPPEFGSKAEAGSVEPSGAAGGD